MAIYLTKIRRFLRFVKVEGRDLNFGKTIGAELMGNKCRNIFITN
jgi:hypothetical protein